MNKQKIAELRAGLETGFINSGYNSSLAYQPQFLSNNHKEGKKVLSSIEDELMTCDKFQISVAFITMGGITPLLQTLKELEKNGIPGEILTTNYLNFSEPKALEKLQGLSNITLKMYDVEKAAEGFHTKGYIFKKEEIYRIIIGSSNMTSAALTSNREWNTKVVSTEQGEVAKQIVEEYNELWNSRYALSFESFYEEYKERYQIIKRQREIAKSEETPSIEKYRLKPNAMQVGFITNLRKILEKGEDRALLISATGTGKTYASAFAMRELGFKRVLFLVHRGQLARQTKKSYEKIFDKSVSMGLVGAGYSDYDRDYVFATVQTLNRDEHLRKYAPDDFDCIILDEAHHSSANTYQKVMNYFTPKLWLGMTATPDKRDDDIDGKNIYQIFNYQIAYEIRLQQAMEENMLCPFHYFGITDVSLLGDKEIRLQNEEFKKQIDDIIEVGLKRYHDKYQSSLKNDSPFVLYEKYSRRDVSLLMNCGRDLSSTMYGMKRIDDDVFIFVTYHKEESTDEQKNYVDGKPDYADAFEDNMIFRWDSQIGRGVDSSYVSDVVNTKRKHLLVKKSDAESNFYYMGEFDIVDVCAARKRDNNGKERDITKFEMKMHHPVREDLLRYLQSNLQQSIQNNTQELKAI